MPWIALVIWLMRILLKEIEGKREEYGVYTSNLFTGEGVTDDQLWSSDLFYYPEKLEDLNVRHWILLHL